LKHSDNRKTYDHFLEYGVPVWRGTGYYYKRHRPGFAGVLLFVVVFASIVHYGLLWLGMWREGVRLREEIEYRREMVKKRKKQKGAVGIKEDEADIAELEQIQIASPRLKDVIGWLLVRATWWLLLWVPRTIWRRLTGAKPDEPDPAARPATPQPGRAARRRKKERENWSLDDQ